MPADDHAFDALKKQFELEDSSISPVPRALVKVGSLLPLPWPLDKAVRWFKDHLAADSLDRLRLMLETCMAEVLKHADQIDQLFKAEDSQDRLDAVRDLLLDAARKSANTRAKERVKRIGSILANGIVEPKKIDSDEIEEMMRIAMELSDSEVLHLKTLVEAEGEYLRLQGSRGRISRWEAHTRWPWGERLDGEVESIFSKLESYGLVARIAPPNNKNIQADLQTRFGLLKKGLRFVDLVQQQAQRQMGDVRPATHGFAGLNLNRAAAGRS